LTAVLVAVKPATHWPTHGAGAKNAAHDAAFFGATTAEAPNFAAPDALTRTL
jgi:hypothetical protein